MPLRGTEEKWLDGSSARIQILAGLKWCLRRDDQYIGMALLSPGLEPLISEEATRCNDYTHRWRNFFGMGVREIAWALCNQANAFYGCS